MYPINWWNINVPHYKTSWFLKAGKPHTEVSHFHVSSISGLHPSRVDGTQVHVQVYVCGEVGVSKQTRVTWERWPGRRAVSKGEINSCWRRRYHPRSLDLFQTTLPQLNPATPPPKPFRGPREVCEHQISMSTGCVYVSVGEGVWGVFVWGRWERQAGVNVRSEGSSNYYYNNNSAKVTGTFDLFTRFSNYYSVIHQSKSCEWGFTHVTITSLPFRMCCMWSQMKKTPVTQAWRLVCNHQSWRENTPWPAGGWWESLGKWLSPSNGQVAAFTKVTMVSINWYKVISMGANLLAASELPKYDQIWVSSA